MKWNCKNCGRETMSNEIKDFCFDCQYQNKQTEKKNRWEKRIKEIEITLETTKTFMNERQYTEISFFPRNSHNNKDIVQVVGYLPPSFNDFGNFFMQTMSASAESHNWEIGKFDKGSDLETSAFLNKLFREGVKKVTTTYKDIKKPNDIFKIEEVIIEKKASLGIWVDGNVEDPNQIVNQPIQSRSRDLESKIEELYTTQRMLLNINEHILRSLNDLRNDIGLQNNSNTNNNNVPVMPLSFFPGFGSLPSSSSVPNSSQKTPSSRSSSFSSSSEKNTQTQKTQKLQKKEERKPRTEFLYGKELITYTETCVTYNNNESYAFISEEDLEELEKNISLKCDELTQKVRKLENEGDDFGSKELSMSFFDISNWHENKKSENIKRLSEFEQARTRYELKTSIEVS